MLGIIRVALQRPLTFIVLAIMIMIFGGIAAVKTPADIFPEIRIPALAVVWTYNGMSADDMGGRVMTQYERTLSSLVNDIERMESTSIPGMGIERIYFQPNVDIRLATTQVSTSSQTTVRNMPAGMQPPTAAAQARTIGRARESRKRESMGGETLVGKTAGRKRAGGRATRTTIE